MKRNYEWTEICDVSAVTMTQTVSWDVAP